MDFSYNPLADPKFSFCDHSLVEAMKLGTPEVHNFFRLLSLCHTAMAEEKSEGEDLTISLNTLVQFTGVQLCGHCNIAGDLSAVFCTR